jgi:ATP adenylyltransferase
VTGLARLWAGWRDAYVQASGTPAAPGTCLFCALPAADDEEGLILERAPATFTVMNLYPYTSGHVMVAPRRHVASLLDLTDAEAGGLMGALRRALEVVQRTYEPDGVNVGANLGRAAGAGIPGHLHVHVVPRWEGDTNFMTAVAETRVLPETLAAGWARLRAGFDALGTAAEAGG